MNRINLYGMIECDKCGTEMTPPGPTHPGTCVFCPAGHPPHPTTCSYCIHREPPAKYHEVLIDGTS